MTSAEIALQLTLKAMEDKAIILLKQVRADDPVNNKNEHNSKEISDFYANIFRAVEKTRSGA